MSDCKTTSGRKNAAVDRCGLAALIKAKGWTVANAALYLGVSRARLYAVFSDPAPIRLWVIAISGLPRCSKSVVADLRKLRQERLATQQENTSALLHDECTNAEKPGEAVQGSGLLADWNGVEPGDIVIALEDRFGMNEGDECVIRHLRPREGGHVDFLVENLASGRQDVVDSEMFFDLFAETGRRS